MKYVCFLRQEWGEVSQYVSRYVPGFEQVDMVEGLSTFIYLVSDMLMTVFEDSTNHFVSILLQLKLPV